MRKTIWTIIVTIILIFISIIIQLTIIKDNKSMISQEFLITELIIGSVFAFIQLPNIVEVGSGIITIKKFINSEYEKEEFSYQQVRNNTEEYLLLSKSPLAKSIKTYYNGILQSHNFIRCDGNKLYITDGTSYKDYIEPSVGAQPAENNSVCFTFEYIAKGI